MKARTVAEYFFSKDPNREVFTLDIIQRNDRKFYEGNLRINKLLQMAQNIYIAKNGQRLIDDDFLAYDNGAVSSDVLHQYRQMQRNCYRAPEMSADDMAYLDKIFLIFANVDIDELIQLSHEDPEWEEQHRKGNLCMDSMAHIADYKEQYAGIIDVMERLC